MTDYSDELDVALGAARAGGRVALRGFRRDPTVEYKADGSPVTASDRAAETAIRSVLARAYPDHNILGEEEGLTSAAGGPARPGAPTWVVDPIDGTKNFVAGIPVWGTLVGLQVDGESSVGVCHAPALGETYDAAIGSGARMNGDAIAVDRVESLDDALILFGDAWRFRGSDLAGFFDELIGRARRTRGFGDCWGHMLVARGAAHVMVEPELSVWDVVPLQPIVAEAGGRLTHFDGTPWRAGGSCLTTNGALHDAVVALAGRPGRRA